MDLAERLVVVLIARLTQIRAKIEDDPKRAKAIAHDTLVQIEKMLIGSPEDK